MKKVIEEENNLQYFLTVQLTKNKINNDFKGNIVVESFVLKVDITTFLISRGITRKA